MKYILTLLFAFYISNGFSQDEVQLNSTNFFVELKEGYDMHDSDPFIYSEDYEIAVMQIGEVNFNAGIKEYDNVEDRYAEKGIKINSIEKSKLGKYNSIIISLDTSPKLVQIIFGDDEFMGIMNVKLLKEGGKIDKELILKDFSSIRHVEFTGEELSKFAKFNIDTLKSTFDFVKYDGYLFAFEDNEADDLLHIYQLPQSKSHYSTQEEKINLFLEPYYKKGADLELIEKGDFETDNMTGYHMLFKVNNPESWDMHLISFFSVSSEKTEIVFQLMLEESKAEPLKSVRDIYNNFSLK